MRVLRPRNRLVIFRLSEQEYQSLKTACADEEARSVSDFARSAVLRSVETGGHPEKTIESRMAALARRLGELEAGVKRILRLLEGSRVTEAARSPRPAWRSRLSS